MLPTRYLKRVWFWLGMGTGTLALAGLVAWIWKTRPHGLNIQPVQIDFSFIRHPAETARGRIMHTAPAEAARAVVAAALASEMAPVPGPLPVPTPELAPEPLPEPAPETTPGAPDDLTLLIGIGPRIAALLRDAGVTTFARLAQADPAWLRELLQAQKLRLADPESWPEQARLAAAGKWDEMKQYAAQRRSARGG